MTHPRSHTTMTREEFRQIRAAANLSIPRLAWLLACKEQTIRNIESGAQRPGKQMAHHLRLLAFPCVREIATQVRRETGVPEPR